MLGQTPLGLGSSCIEPGSRCSVCGRQLVRWVGPMPCQDRIRGMLSGIQGHNLWVDSHRGRHLPRVCKKAICAQGRTQLCGKECAPPPQVACPECFPLSPRLSAGCWACHLCGIGWAPCWHRAAAHTRAQWMRQLQPFPTSFSHTFPALHSVACEGHAAQ